MFLLTMQIVDEYGMTNIEPVMTNLPYSLTIQNEIYQF